MIADVVTIFPAMVESALAAGVVGRARERGLVEIRVRDLRDYTDDRHRTVDDVPYGGGPGMVMKAEPIGRAVDAITAERGRPSAVVLMTPQGERFTQAVAAKLSRLERLIVIAGRYEGIDERVAASVVTDEISIGDYVLTGGELAALVVLDAVTRLVPGVVGDAASVETDSFSGGLLDCPHYTRPVEWRGQKVPDVLMSGHHKAIDTWRRHERIRRTVERRPDLLDDADLSVGERRDVQKLQEAREAGDGPRREVLEKETSDEGD